MRLFDEAVDIDESHGKRRVMGADGSSIHFLGVMEDEDGSHSCGVCRPKLGT